MAFKLTDTTPPTPTGYLAVHWLKDGDDFVSGFVDPMAVLFPISFDLASGVTGTNVAPIRTALRAGSFSKCVVSVKTADPSVALTFRIKQNGTSIFATNPTLAGGTAATTNAASTHTFTAFTTNPLVIAEKDVFTLDVTAGSSAWNVSVCLY